MVDDAVGECERAHARRLASVGGEVGAGHGRELACEPPRVGCRAIFSEPATAYFIANLDIFYELAVVVVNAAGALPAPR